MSTASKISLWKKGLGVMAAAALASVVMVAPAFATDAVSVQGYTTNTGTVTSNSPDPVTGDTQMYIQQAPAGAISVTAPTKLYFYLTNEADHTTAGGVQNVPWGQFLVPSKDVVTLTNNGTVTTKVSEWEVTNTAGTFNNGGDIVEYAFPMSKADYDVAQYTWATGDTQIKPQNGTASNTAKQVGEYYLIGIPNGAPNAFDLAVDNASPSAVNWTLLPNGTPGNVIEIDLEGEMQGINDDLKTWFQSGDRPLQTVTWTFAAV